MHHITPILAIILCSACVGQAYQPRDAGGGDAPVDPLEAACLSECPEVGFVCCEFRERLWGCFPLETACASCGPIQCGAGLECVDGACR